MKRKTLKNEFIVERLRGRGLENREIFTLGMVKLGLCELNREFIILLLECYY